MAETVVAPRKTRTVAKPVAKKEPAKTTTREEHFGPFTIVEITDTETQIVGVGLSKRGVGDSPNPALGTTIATGRAKKALEVKRHNASILAKIDQAKTAFRRKALRNQIKSLQEPYMG